VLERPIPLLEPLPERHFAAWAIAALAELVVDLPCADPLVRSELFREGGDDAA